MFLIRSQKDTFAWRKDDLHQPPPQQQLALDEELQEQEVLESETNAVQSKMHHVAKRGPSPFAEPMGPYCMLNESERVVKRAIAFFPDGNCQRYLHVVLSLLNFEPKTNRSTFETIKTFYRDLAETECPSYENYFKNQVISLGHGTFAEFCQISSGL